MATMIEVWQINKEGQLQKINSTLAEEGRNEPDDLEGWLSKNPEIISTDLRLIGRQVATKTGELDLLGIDSSGNILIIELKRDLVPRLALSQAIDYASDIATWDIEKLSEVCIKFNGSTLDEFFVEQFPSVEIENIAFNSLQRIILVGFAIEEPLQRMIEWLFNQYSVSINAVALKYIKTKGGEELIAKTSIFDEEIEKIKTTKKFILPKSDEPGNYDDKVLKEKLINYFSDNRKIFQAIKTVILPLCLNNKIVTRDMIKEEIVNQGISPDKGKSFTIVSNISTQMSLEKNDFLRQVISYSYPNNFWEKDNYMINEKYRSIIQELVNSK
ncbi:endonuclease NucS domain-containing protein [Leptospira bandrabouensis]|uniref:endonuclease NucS domain-containing protein n=1 Tax=Leptospira bandrabouensis TaxID=2484903 RepID=UPI001EE8AF9A|nr:endonuclease NucS domain-containing protein [Leptospira bandrabouensis]MCG6146578.1 endonuclease NucS [Leptospira bandrabouensis]MCG6161961.1 endonuclease NucS [Leptospira bandrabouensis]MCG6166146.1 endonuclease NucS [Leptospira bandrabouensis]